MLLRLAFSQLFSLFEDHLSMPLYMSRKAMHPQKYVPTVKMKHTVSAAWLLVGISYRYIARDEAV